MNLRYTNPKYPIGIVSKNRADSMYTSRSLSRMKVPHYIVIEPQDKDAYEDALDKFEIRDYVNLIVAPFSNHGDGPGRARNYFWDFTKHDLGSEYHWVCDDNIQDFYRLHKNQRIRVESGVCFRVSEDFVYRYENVPVSGFQYRFFIAPNTYYPPFTVNTRIYSTLLIRNDWNLRWRGKYNEDSDLTIRVLKSGNCTIQFNAFLQGKCATQTVKGGNTEEFYHKEFLDDPNSLKGKKYHEMGTWNKSKMLVDMHPDICRMVWRYDRWHHHCNYEKYKSNKLILKDEYKNLSNEPNNYGMKLIKDYSPEKYS